MKKLIWVLCEEDEEGKWNYYQGPRGIPILDHDEIKGGLFRK